MKPFRNYLPEDILIPFFGQKKVVGVEIGVWRAEGSVGLLSKMPNLKLYSIDPWLHQKGRGYEAEGDQDGQDLSYSMATGALNKYADRSIILRMKSDDAVNEINELIDFVWIDGDHNEDTVRRDIINWRSKLKSKSILCGHDWRFDHIQKAVKELGEPKLGDDDIWYFEYE